jgi:hypothetical protein
MSSLRSVQPTARRDVTRCVVGLNVWSSLGRVKHCAGPIDKVYQAVIRLWPDRVTGAEQMVD